MNPESEAAVTGLQLLGVIAVYGLAIVLGLYMLANFVLWCVDRYRGIR